MTLVDTSSWVHQLQRKGNPEIRTRVERLLVDGEACWCAPVRLELWSGVGRDPERKILREYARVLLALPINDDVWQTAEQLAESGRRRGFQAPSMDILIAACARVHGVPIEHDDAHFEQLQTLSL